METHLPNPIWQGRTVNLPGVFPPDSGLMVSFDTQEPHQNFGASIQTISRGSMGIPLSLVTCIAQEDSLTLQDLLDWSRRRMSRSAMDVGMG